MPFDARADAAPQFEAESIRRSWFTNSHWRKQPLNAARSLRFPGASKEFLFPETRRADVCPSEVGPADVSLQIRGRLQDRIRQHKPLSDRAKDNRRIPNHRRAALQFCTGETASERYRSPIHLCDCGICLIRLDVLPCRHADFFRTSPKNFRGICPRDRRSRFDPLSPGRARGQIAIGIARGRHRQDRHRSEISASTWNNHDLRPTVDLQKFEMGYPPE